MIGNGSTLTISKIIGGLSKTINIANQVIPIYKQAKPLINGLAESKNTIKNIASTFFKDTPTQNSKKSEYNNSNKIINIPNSPTFFIKKTN